MSISKTNAILAQNSKYQTTIHTNRSIEMARKLVNFARSDLNSGYRQVNSSRPMVEIETKVKPDGI